MKAAVYRQYGSANVLHEETLALPIPKANEIRITVRACEVTKADCELRSLNFPVKWFAFPLRLALGVFAPRNPVLGGYIAGVVDAVGENVTHYKIGDRVLGSTGFRFGGYGEQVCVPQTASIAVLPDSVAFTDAAASILGGLNALHFIRLANITEGETLLINGAGGSIGAFAVQLAKQKGAIVTAVDAPHKLEFLSTLGADIVIDYTQSPISSLTEQYDAVFNMVADARFDTLIGRLKPKGRFLTGNPKLSDMFKCWRLNRTKDQSAFFSFAAESIEELEELRDLLKEKVVVPTIDCLISRDSIVDAHTKVENETRLGAVVLVHS
jgi:NADPH:quinone reductase-like Zn-dependent oxidoreductase